MLRIEIAYTGKLILPVPEGFDKVQSEIPEEQMIAYWNTSKVWGKLACYLAKL